MLLFHAFSIYKIRTCLRLAFLPLLIILSIHVFLREPLSTHTESKSEPIEPKIHVTYLHFMDTTEQVTIENLKYFLHFAYKPCDQAVDYTFIFNTNKFNRSSTKNHPVYGLTPELKAYLQKIIDPDWLKSAESNTLFITDGYIGGDLCSYSNYINSMMFMGRRFRYKYFFYINSSVRGPFLPSYWKKPWSVFFYF